jgi:hypothetical protein
MNESQINEISLQFTIIYNVDIFANKKNVYLLHRLIEFKNKFFFFLVYDY